MEGVIECDWDTLDGYREVSALLAAGHRPRALVCLADRVSFGAYQALGEAGLSVPGDVSVISFDDQDIASVLRPALTTLRLPHYRLGHLAMELILRPGPLEAVVHRVPMPLQSRASSPHPPAADTGTEDSRPAARTDDSGRVAGRPPRTATVVTGRRGRVLQDPSQ